MIILQNNGVWERWVMGNGVVTYEEGFCKRDENKYGDLLEIWQQDEWSFRILGMREG